MSTLASEITIADVCSTVCSGWDQRKHQSSASMAYVAGIHQWPVDSPHKRPVTRKCVHLMTSSCFAGISGIWNVISIILELNWWKQRNKPQEKITLLRHSINQLYHILLYHIIWYYIHNPCKFRRFYHKSHTRTLDIFEKATRDRAHVYVKYKILYSDDDVYVVCHPDHICLHITLSLREVNMNFLSTCQPASVHLRLIAHEICVKCHQLAGVS